MIDEAEVRSLARLCRELGLRELRMDPSGGVHMVLGPEPHAPSAETDPGGAEDHMFSREDMFGASAYEPREEP